MTLTSNLKLKTIDFTPLKSPQGDNRSIKIFSFNLEFDSFITCVLLHLVNRKMLDDDTPYHEQAQIIRHYFQDLML